jgi:hypothetical protein
VGVFATAGLGMIILSYFFFDTLSSGLVLAVVGTALILACGQTGFCSILLSRPAVVHIGKISYSLYLWHWPVLVLAAPLGLDWPGVTDKALLLVVIYVLALGTWQLIEKPARRRPGVVRPVLLSGTVVAVAAAGMALVPRAFDTSGFDVQQWLEYNCRPNWEPETSRLFHNVVVENANYKADAMSSGNGIRTGDESITPEVIVLGDSHGTMWSAAIADVTEELNIPAAFFVIGHGENPFFAIPPELDSSNSSGVLTPDQRLMFDTVRLRALTNWKPRLVVITARWNEEHRDLSGDLLTFLKTRNTEVLLIEDPPVLSTNGENAMQFLAWKGLLPEQPVEGQPWHVPCQVLKKNEGDRATACRPVRQCTAAANI